ncbi:MAG: thioesterase [Planctomycetes bacterium]|jgi:acyl-ACP thioesterase|nr:thioesterase [Planctomycetota bacterium]
MIPREDRFVVDAFDCRPDGLLKPNVLMQYLQEAAARHAQQLGLGLADLQRQDSFWVLVNFRLEMAQAPRWGDDLTIRTWPSGFTRLLAAREFLGQRADGTELFRAASEWMILDRHHGRPRNLSRLNLNLPAGGPKALATELIRLRPGEAYTQVCTVSVPFSALDFNGHVNNTEYVRWALDALHRRLGHSPALRMLQATYTAEVFEGDAIEVLVSADGETPIRILERKANGASAANVFLLEVLPA